MLSRPVVDSKNNVLDKRLIKPVVYIIDSDQKLQLSLSRLLNLHDVAVELFESAEEFLKIKLSLNMQVQLVVS